MNNLPMRCKIHNIPLSYEEAEDEVRHWWCPVCEHLREVADAKALAKAEAENPFFRPQVDEDEEPREW